MRKLYRAGFRSLLLALALCGALAVQADTTTSTDARQFEVISVDGKPMAVGELKAGMKGAATITKTTTVRPVSVTNIKMGTVVSQTGRSITIKEDNGKIHRFSQDDADAPGIQIFMNDRAVRIFNLNPGDQVTATIMSAGAPEILTAQQVDAELAAATDAASTGAAAGTVSAATAAAASEATGDASAALAPMPPPEKTASNNWLWLLVRSRPKKIPIRHR